MLSLVKSNRSKETEDILERHISVVETPKNSDSLLRNALSKADLIDRGMVQITSWAHSPESKNALRVRKAKKKAESGENGKTPSKQLNVTAPVDGDARNALKKLSALMLSGDVTADDLKILGRSDIIHFGSRVDQIYKKGGLRARLLRRLLK